MSLFGGQAAAPQPGFGSTPSLFGAPAQSSASLFGAQSTPSLFGAPAQGPAATFGAPAQSSASLFGQSAQSSASLFGTPAQSSALFGAPAQGSGSLFGSSAQSTSLFGAPAQSAPSLFGAPQSSGSLFSAPAQSSSLFSAPAQSGGSLFGAPNQSSSAFWQGNQSQQQQQQQNAQQPAEITGLTRISHLPQNFQTDLFAVERHLRDQRSKSSKLWSKRSNYETDIGLVRTRCTNVTRQLVKLQALLESLSANSDALKAAVRAERGHAEPVIIALENISKGNHSHQLGFINSSDGLRYSTSEGRTQDRSTHVPEEYFIRILDELESRAHEYKREIDEIAEYLRAQGVVLSSTSGSTSEAPGKRRPGAAQISLLDNISQRHMDMGISGSRDSVASKGKTIEDIIRRQYEYFMVVAGHIAGVSENLRSTRQQFLRLLRARDPDVLNPFEQADLREKAEKERQRMMADHHASESALTLGSSFVLTSSSQGSLFQSQSGGGASVGFGNAMSGFGQSGGLFGGAPTTGFGGSMNGSNGTNASGRRGSSGRRKRS